MFDKKFEIRPVSAPSEYRDLLHPHTLWLP